MNTEEAPGDSPIAEGIAKTTRHCASLAIGDWHTLFFELESRLERLARRRFPADRTTAEIAHNRVLDKLCAGDWALLRQFRGGSAPATYLTSVYRNALEDVARSILGRCRPPKHIEQMGELWVAVFQLLCCHRRLDGELAGLLDEHRPIELDADSWDRELRAIARRIRARVPNCGGRLLVSASTDRDDDVPADPSMEPSEEAQVEETDLLNRTLHELLTGAESRTADRQLNELRARLETLALDPEAVLLARLVYIEQSSLPDAARILAINERTARRRIDELFRQLRAVLQPYV